MSFLKTMQISASGLTAQRYRMDIIAENLANIETTRTSTGEVYRKKYVVLESMKENAAVTFDEAMRRASGGTTGAGVRIAEVGRDMSDLKVKYDPTHPDADEEGYVQLPNVDLTQEMVDMLSAYRSYEANITAFNAFKDMAVKTLEIGNG